MRPCKFLGSGCANLSKEDSKFDFTCCDISAEILSPSTDSVMAVDANVNAARNIVRYMVDASFALNAVP